MADQEASLLELGQHAINGSETHIVLLIEQHAVHVFGRQMALVAGFKQIEDFQPGASGLQAGILEIARFAHDGVRADMFWNGVRGYDTALPHLAAVYARPWHANQACRPAIYLHGLNAFMRTLLIAALLAGLSACSYLTPYKLDVPQGNAVTADQVEVKDLATGEQTVSTVEVLCA